MGRSNASAMVLCAFCIPWVLAASYEPPPVDEYKIGAAQDVLERASRAPLDR
jgi:hypothetical protein